MKRLGVRVLVFAAGALAVSLAGCDNPFDDVVARMEALEAQAAAQEAEIAALEEERDQIAILPAINPELGTIRGIITLPADAPAEMDITSISVYSPQVTGFITNPNAEGEFIIPNLEVDGVYDVIATTDELGIRSRSLGRGLPPDVIPR